MAERSARSACYGGVAPGSGPAMAGWTRPTGGHGLELRPNQYFEAKCYNDAWQDQGTGVFYVLQEVEHLSAQGEVFRCQALGYSTSTTGGGQAGRAAVWSGSTCVAGETGIAASA